MHLYYTQWVDEGPGRGRELSVKDCSFRRGRLKSGLVLFESRK